MILVDSLISLGEKSTLLKVLVNHFLFYLSVGARDPSHDTFPIRHPHGSVNPTLERDGERSHTGIRSVNYRCTE